MLHENDLSNVARSAVENFVTFVSYIQAMYTRNEIELTCLKIEFVACFIDG